MKNRDELDLEELKKKYEELGAESGSYAALPPNNERNEI